MNLKSFIFIFLLAVSQQAYSCSCDFEGIDYKDAKHVFIGQRIGKNSFLSFSDRRYRFKVLHSYQGVEASSIKVWTPKYGPACGVKFKKNVEYVIMAYEYEGKIFTSNCSAWEKDGYRNYQTKALEEAFSNK